MTRELEQAISRLNPAQREAVHHTGSPLLILAGAGSGKTRVITVKIAWLIETEGVDPQSILAVTFTNRAAAEMRTRIGQLVGDASEITIRTFHSFGAWMLRRNADRAGLPRDFSIYDDDDQVSLLRTIAPEHPRSSLRRVAHQISRAKDYGLRPDDDLTDISYDAEFADLYRRYHERLSQIGNVDFGELILRPVELLEQDERVRSRLHQRFRFVLVDEYQDSNVAQYRMLSALCDDTTGVCVVGDDDQSIYRFRGAEVRNILDFPDTFPGTHVVRLEQNYRSTRPILDLASAVVENNASRLGKRLVTDRDDGEIPELHLLPDQDAEVDLVIDLVDRAARAGDTGELAVLYRTNAQSRPFETALLRAGIPYRIVGSVRFYEREEVKDALAFLRLIANPRDEVSFRRVVNKPARGIGARTVERILEGVAATNGDLLAAARAATGSLAAKASRALADFVRVVTGLDAAVGPESDAPDDDANDTPLPAPSNRDVSLAALLERLLAESGLAAYYREQDEIGSSQKIENLEELANAASLYPVSRAGLREFLEAIELDSAREQEQQEAPSRVVLITMHNTKGLEFDRVVITGLEEGLFPRGDDPDELEEERRLMYVAITRARHELTLTSCRLRRIHGRITDLLPSRFLTEIPDDVIRVASGGWSAGSGARRAPSGTDAAAEGEWPRGTTVYHDDYGSGIVTRAWYTGGELSILVRFETGMTAQFLPAYTPIERIAGSDAW